jgi:hypothetical protein
MIYELVVNGLKSTQKVEENLRNRIQALLESAPSDASASAKFKKAKRGYEGLIEIFSSQGKFVAEAVGGNLNEVIHNISGQILKQIKDWRGYRFQIQ